jgi:hypothetical protein
MSDSIPTLTEAAAAVSVLGGSQADIDLLDDASLLAGMRLVRELEQATQPYKLWLAAAIARRSDHTLGYGGLARKRGYPTPAIFIQSMTGSSIEEATKLARLGQSMVDATATGVELTPVATAAVSGGISVDAADAIRRGLGVPDSAVTTEQLATAARELVARAGGMTPEGLLKAARRVRGELDVEAIDRGEKQRSATRYARIWKRDGMCGGSWCLPEEDGGLEIHNTMKLMLAKKTGGPRFADTNQTTTGAKSADTLIEDYRGPDHILADGFAQLFHNGLTADPSVVPGAGRAAVRVIVTEKVLTERAGSALLEESMTAISFGKLGEYLCEGGTVGVICNDDGTIDVGREQRLFTPRQRTVLGVRDGGCRFPGCEKPPSWCEAHHIEYWAKDHGRTDTQNGILLCRYHHMLIHNKNWEIIRNTHQPGTGGTDPGGDYWLKPPKNRDPNQTPIPMPSKNPLIAAMRLATTAA